MKLDGILWKFRTRPAHYFRSEEYSGRSFGGQPPPPLLGVIFNFIGFLREKS